LAKNKPKIPAQFDAGEKDEVPFAIILGADELRDGKVTVKEQRWQFVDGKKEKIQSTSKGELIERATLISYLKQSNALQQWETGRLI
jgi:histidyl-tRNA synthetase